MAYNLGAESSGSPDKCRAVSSWADGTVGGRVQRPVDILDVHQRIQLPSLVRTQDVRLDAERSTQLSTFRGCSAEVKAFHTRYRALGPELIPVYRQPAHSHSPGGRLPLLSARPAVTFPAAEHHRPLAGTKLYCLVTGVNNLPKVVVQLCPE